MSDKPLGLLSRPINLLVVHHSASPRETTLEDLTRWHKERGFTTIGYHFVIDHLGSILPGRDLALIGAHAKGHNDHSIGLCIMGDNTKEGQGWSVGQVQALSSFVFWFRRFFPGAGIVGHRDLPGAATLCPGLDIQPLLRELGAGG